MSDLAGFPYAEVQFGKQGELIDRAGVDPWAAALPPGTDVLVISHGWNNDMGRARELYGDIARHLRSVLETSPPAGLGERSFAILGVLWPSKRWAERALIPGGSASASGDAADAEIEQRLDDLRGSFDAEDADARLARARELVSELEDDPAARDEFADVIRGLLGDSATDDDGDLPPQYHSLSGDQILTRLKAPLAPAAPQADEGGAAGLGFSLTGFKAAAERLLNTTTYYQMKARAGKVGAEGLNPLLRGLRGDLRLHLIGHSFGGRLVTATTLGADGAPALRPYSLTLLQAAFSHYGFSGDWDEEGSPGFFRRIIDEQLTRGPIVVTHSVLDRAVGYAYPVASRLGGQAAAGLGDADDKYGGIGRNGAQRTGEADAGKLLPAGEAYTFAPHRLANLNADTVILDHSDIARDEVAYAILSAVAAAPRS